MLVRKLFNFIFQILKKQLCDSLRRRSSKIEFVGTLLFKFVHSLFWWKQLSDIIVKQFVEITENNGGMTKNTRKF